MRRVLVAVVAVVLVNLPWANDAWIQHRIDSSGVTVTVTVKDQSQRNGNDYVSYYLPKSIDPHQHLYGVEVDAATYRKALEGTPITARVVPGSPNDNRIEGQSTGSIVIVIGVVGDAIIVLLVGFSLLRRRRWSHFEIVGVEGDLLTVLTSGDRLIVRLADDAETCARIQPLVGSSIKGVLYLKAGEDVVEGPPVGEITHLHEAEYRMAGRARSVSSVRTDVLLENGYLLPVIGDDVAHEAELRGPVTAVGTLLLAARRARLES